MDNIEIVGISGKAGSGKDYIAKKMLVPLGFRQYSFAWHFKVWIVASGQATYEEVFITKPPHIRKLLQEEGTERGRMIYGDNIWTNVAETWFKVNNVYNGDTKFVIPDVRFPSEVDAIRKMGGKVLRIIAPRRSNDSTLTLEARNHVSETALDLYTNFDGYIFNDPEYSEMTRKQLSQYVDLSDDEVDPEEVLDGLLVRIIKKLENKIGL